MIEQPPGLSRRLRAFSVHLLTATGAGLALMALFAAAEGRWGAMFGWLGVALLVDAIDGPIARTMRVKEILPHWSGDTLDLVVDFTTYVFVPAYAIAASGFIVPSLAAPLGIAIVMSGALYFVDLRMKTDDNHFRGFPTLWNAAAFYLFLLKPSPWIATAFMGLLVIATFLPFHALHPVRVQRWRMFNLAIVIFGCVLAALAVWLDFDVPPPVPAILCLIGLYVLFGDAVIRLVRWLRQV
ncbi:MAG: phosphatidylcholine synthase [Xanthobacteraceae bacterium]